jgi:hypothetical protein
MLGCALGTTHNTAVSPSFQVIHDFGHTGVTNDFLVNAKDTLAIRYNDQSPNESFHASGALCLLTVPKHNFLSHLSKASS